MKDYLGIPLKLENATQKSELQRVSLEQSIHNLVHLIIVSANNDVKHNPVFGTIIGESDFNNIYNVHTLKERLKKSILSSIVTSEKRLKQVNISLNIKQTEINTRIKNKRVKTLIQIIVKGIIAMTNEDFKHLETFYIGPLSY